MIGADTNEAVIDCEFSKLVGSLHTLKEYPRNQSNDVGALKNGILEIPCAEERWSCIQCICDISDYLEQSPELAIGVEIKFTPPKIGKYVLEAAAILLGCQFV